MTPMKRPHRGWFVTFEGVDGSGKTTQLRLLAESLRREGHTVVETREPGGTPIAEKIRSLLLDPANTAMTPRAELLLYEAARAQHVEEVIRPALERGEIVLCDRFTDATLAYQGYGRGFPLEELRRLNAFATDGLQPDLTFLFDVDWETSRERVGSRGQGQDRLEGEAEVFHRRVRAGYQHLAAQETARIVLLDGSHSAAVIQSDIRRSLPINGIVC